MELGAEIRLQAAPFDPAAEQRMLLAGRCDIGAVVAFTGFCRDEGGRLSALELEHYPGMAEAEIGRICAEAAARWPLLALKVIHRFGRLEPGEAIVLVICAATHRAAAFSGADFIMDFLKSRAPFWKKEHEHGGVIGAWVCAKEEDETALSRWN